MGALVLAAVGVVMIAAGSMITSRKVKGEFGAITPRSMAMSQGTGVVPRWVSFVVLAGWVAVAAGAIWFLVSLL